MNKIIKIDKNITSKAALAAHETRVRQHNKMNTLVQEAVEYKVKEEWLDAAFKFEEALACCNDEEYAKILDHEATQCMRICELNIGG